MCGRATPSTPTVDQLPHVCSTPEPAGRKRLARALLNYLDSTVTYDTFRNGFVCDPLHLANIAAAAITAPSLTGRPALRALAPTARPQASACSAYPGRFKTIFYQIPRGRQRRTAHADQRRPATHTSSPRHAMGRLLVPRQAQGPAHRSLLLAVAWRVTARAQRRAAGRRSRVGRRWAWSGRPAAGWWPAL